MSQWMRVTPTGLKPMAIPAIDIDLDAPIPAGVQARLDAQFKKQRDIWLGNQHITTNADGSIKNIEINAQYQVSNATAKTTKLINSAEVLQNTSPYNSAAQQKLDSFTKTTQGKKPTIPDSINQNSTEKLPAISELSPAVNAKLDALFSATRSTPANPVEKTLPKTIADQFLDTEFIPENNNHNQATLTLNDLNVSESQSIALQRVGLGLNLSEKATNDIAQLKANLVAQTVKQTENVVTQVNARYNPFAAAQQVASQFQWRGNTASQTTPDTKILAEAGLMPQSGTTDKRASNGGTGLTSGGSGQSSLSQRRKQTK